MYMGEGRWSQLRGSEQHVCHLLKGLLCSLRDEQLLSVVKDPSLYVEKGRAAGMMFIIAMLLQCKATLGGSLEATAASGEKCRGEGESRKRHRSIEGVRMSM